MQVNIADIRIGERYRKDMGDIEGLARSMNEIGLLHPVAIDADYRLIAGERRILAAKMLGWQAIEAHFVDLEAKPSEVVKAVAQLSEDDRASFEEFLDRQEKDWREQVYAWNAQFGAPLGDNACAVCGYKMFVEKHHFLPKAMGGTDDPRNFVALCPTHHAGVHWLMSQITKANMDQMIRFWRTDGQDDPLLFKFYLGRVAPLAKALENRR